jgi:2-beta-glucuronyltransferase
MVGLALVVSSQPMLSSPRGGAASRASQEDEDAPMKRVVLITNQFYESKNKAGFHFLADAFWNAGWDVLFFTESISWISWLRRDARFANPIREHANQLRAIKERLHSYVWFTPFHPVNLRNDWLNRMSGPLLKTYGQFSFRDAEPAIRAADLFVFDSDHGLFLFDRFKQMNPEARCVYRVSDDLPAMRHHPVVIETEERLLERFDLVSVPSEYIQRRLSAVAPIQLHKHALQRDLFDEPCANPYEGDGPHLLFVGRSRFDRDFLRRAIKLFPDWSFHLFGAAAAASDSPRVHVYGERPFADLIPYLRHADIGLQTLEYWPGAECFTDSLKMQQYTYCKLPIVAPAFLCGDRAHVFGYEPGNDASIRQALLAASQFNRERVPWHEVESWDDVMLKLAG